MKNKFLILTLICLLLSLSAFMTSCGTTHPKCPGNGGSNIGECHMSSPPTGLTKNCNNICISKQISNGGVSTFEYFCDCD
ncbi:hypothetical protein R84B8_01807 [Treponema sp. R8-4-B8]